MHISAPVL